MWGKFKDCFLELSGIFSKYSQSAWLSPWVQNPWVWRAELWLGWKVGPQYKHSTSFQRGNIGPNAVEMTAMPRGRVRSGEKHVLLSTFIPFPRDSFLLNPSWIEQSGEMLSEHRWTFSESHISRGNRSKPIPHSLCLGSLGGAQPSLQVTVGPTEKNMETHSPLFRFCGMTWYPLRGQKNRFFLS